MKLKYKNLYSSVLAEYEALSTCARLHVAAILVKDGRILSVGYNGVPKGQCHCTAYFKQSDDGYMMRSTVGAEWESVSEELFKTAHHNFAEEREIHAEMNCIAFALKNGINVEDCEMILSVAPCMNCAKLIAASGIKNVSYIRKYDRSMEGENFLKQCGINIAPVAN